MTRMAEAETAQSRNRYSPSGSIREVQQGYLVAKRLFDILAALALGVVLLVPMVLLAIVIKLDSPGPALFLQERMGQGGKVFRILKFRSMYLDAPSQMATRDFEDVGEYTTRVGGFIRRTSLDELPQLWNILLGQMSFVGYRPVCLSETDLNRLRMEYGVFEAQPGLTGLAQVSGRDDLTDVTKKARIDAYYVRNRSIRLDIECLLRTVKTVLSKEGVI